MPDHAELFHEANSLGAKRFGTLWLQATADLVGMLKEAGFGDQLERDYKLRAGVARGLYRVLMTATGHPNNLARALSLAETERMLKKAEEWGAKED